jgi:NAD(P)-dependent dehydrogenase (short-subunit alcohol dehydrogenase family)
LPAGIRSARESIASSRKTDFNSSNGFGKPNTAAVPCDVTQSDQVAAAATTVSEHTGGTLDLLINNVGYSPRDGAIEAADMTEYRRAFEVNFWGPVQVVQAMTPRLVVHPVSAG